MTLALTAELPPLIQDETGTVRVRGSRITLDWIAHAMRVGKSAEDVVADSSTLDLGDVYAVFSYCLRHRVEVDEYLARREREAQDLRQKIEATQRPFPSKAELLARKAARENPT